MLNKTIHTAYLSDQDINHPDEACDINAMLTKYLPRQQCDELKQTAWYQRRKKWQIAIQYRDLTMIRRAIQLYPENWVDYLADTIELSLSRSRADWLMAEIYHAWIKEYHHEFDSLKKEYHEYYISENQLAARHYLYQQNRKLLNADDISHAEKTLAACKRKVRELQQRIDLLASHISFSLRDFHCAVRAQLYQNGILPPSGIPAPLQEAIQSLLLLKEQNHHDALQTWLYQKNICLRHDILRWE